ncbi:unnamed protein product [Bursaphelenchus xylophilus]|uniref:(pine wood nematode) hypothetical protein n=1 Tax=Bursaphelenchus xylophilus TaxID=6326 RepID=A0A1I7RXD6_BURXY|nr:unnamed protein product [Bursaphelenchus xylophilus]CAG9126305.1 unnamed protein product [Bursaphelenchus xylophilus]
MHKLSLLAVLIAAVVVAKEIRVEVVVSVDDEVLEAKTSEVGEASEHEPGSFIKGGGKHHGGGGKHPGGGGKHPGGGGGHKPKTRKPRPTRPHPTRPRPTRPPKPTQAPVPKPTKPPLPKRIMCSLCKGVINAASHVIQDPSGITKEALQTILTEKCKEEAEIGDVMCDTIIPTVLDVAFETLRQTGGLDGAAICARINICPVSPFEFFFN